MKAPNAFATRLNLSRFHSSQIVRKMQEKSPVDLVRMAHALDVISVVDSDASVRKALTGALCLTGENCESVQCADEFSQFSRSRSTSCLIANVQWPGVAGPELCQHQAAASVSHSPVKPFIESERLACINSIVKRQTVHARQL
ncbi:hypothetical protein [Bradyrhizobium sp. LMTR 3]|uniref:hypothetical protein n=1 Tax=Bradyrhizobium sp. LMTR 3 TaxID=189873 RepID=UPI00114755C6|nr:hypothetical protein [Bradyrhizobium sp. LMTR 3]